MKRDSEKSNFYLRLEDLFSILYPVNNIREKGKRVV